MGETMMGVFFVVLLVGSIGAAIYARITRSQKLLTKWASDNGYELVHAEDRLFRKGPYGWSSKNQVVYRVWVRDAQGNEHTGWVRCGDYMMGVFADKVEAKLDSPPESGYR